MLCAQKAVNIPSYGVPISVEQVVQEHYEYGHTGHAQAHQYGTGQKITC
jgi:hypothetical protein